MPLILSTWKFGLVANSAGYPVLQRGGSALDAVEQAAIAVELNGGNHSVGVGGMPDASGVVTLDGCIMLSPQRSAGVACVRNYPHVVSIARKVMELTPHKLLAGPGAEAFAAACGFPQRDLLVEESRRRWQLWQSQPDDDARRRLFNQLNQANRERGVEMPHDTIGVLALDASGTLAGGCSTSGMAFKLPGRVGDSPIIGHGLYVDPAVGGATATGNGELMMGTCASFLACERLRAGDAPLDAALHTLKRIAASYSLTPVQQTALIVMRHDGAWACAALRPGFLCAVTDEQGQRLIDAHAVMFP